MLTCAAGSSPFSGSAVLLPLNPENNYQPEIFICGGSDLPDFEPLSFYTINDPASNQCLRMTLTPEGIQKGWEVEHMPQGRTMLNMNLLPDGRVVIVNGAQSGIAAYDTVRSRNRVDNVLIFILIICYRFQIVLERAMQLTQHSRRSCTTRLLPVAKGSPRMVFQYQP